METKNVVKVVVKLRENRKEMMSRERVSRSGCPHNHKRRGRSHHDGTKA